ncbi:hypothetical protein H5410_046310 [Solanum commersonii]|uniref:Uncharacterized protein n=1 Tax=Solanum commersonii TaxID=4109 RepID=A0A9J5XF63_SOLCO|nr:hypothetical protein H5410_046310 [Solanum commersonii]
MTSPSENHNLAIIPYEYQESPFIRPDVMLADSFGVIHLAYPLVEDTSIQREELYQRLISEIRDNTDSHCRRELKFPRNKFIPRIATTTYSAAFGKCPSSEPSVPIPEWVTRVVQRDLDAVVLTKSTKKSHGKKSKFILPENPIDIIDNVIEPKKDKKRKRSACMSSLKKQDTVSKLAQGWNALFLQGNIRHKMGRKETREFYINLVGSTSSITSKVGGIYFTLIDVVLSNILGVPNVGWCHYVKRTWPPLEGLSSALEISRRFAHDPMFEGYTRVDKGATLPLHKLFFDVVHKIVLPRFQKRTEANYLDLTLMELLISNVQINFPKFVLNHIHRICVHDDKDHGLGYGFWLGEVFEYFRISVIEWQEQTTKNVLGKVDHVVIPTTSRGANAPVQRLKALLTTNNEEIIALRVTHLTAMDQLIISYGLEHAGLVEENSRLKEELAKTQAALETERLPNSAYLKNLVNMFR